MVAGAGRENGMETPMHENPEWEKARQALASISKAGAAGSSAKASSNGPVAGAQVREVPAGLGTLSGAGSTVVSSGITRAGRSEDAPGALEWGCPVCLLEESRAIWSSPWGVQPKEGEVPGWDGRGGGLRGEVQPRLRP